MQSQLSERRADRNATKRSIKKLEHKIQDLKDDVEPLKSRELTAYEAKEAAYYKEYRAQLSKWKRMTLAQESVELQRLRHNQAVKAQYEHSQADRVRFCERIRRDIERIFTPTYKVFWRILPMPTWFRRKIRFRWRTLGVVGKWPRPTACDLWCRCRTVLKS